MKAFALTIPILLVGLATLTSTQSSLAAQGAERLKFVHTLIEQSSAARQIEASGNPAAKAKREQARALYRKAAAADKAGDAEAREKALSAATQTMFEAVHLAGQEQVVAGKKKRDFKNRLESVQALIAAHERISAEKGQKSASKKLQRTVDPKVAHAQTLFAQGELDAARKQLDEAYVTAKVAIEKLRGGDTLIRSLHFANKEEEYRYEVDRNDTHRMLIKVLLKEKMEQAAVQRRVNPPLKKADELRAKAEKQAAQGKYEDAVRTLEDSTKELVRAIRSAGIYIPG